MSRTALMFAGLTLAMIFALIGWWWFEKAPVSPDIALRLERSLRPNRSGPMGPERRQAGWAQSRFAVSQKKILESQPDIVLLGDSITQGFENTGTLWQSGFTPFKVVNAGISSDRFQHILYRVKNGQLEHSPRLSVLLCGINNLAMNSTDQIQTGIRQIVEELRSQHPEMSILVLGIFPAGRQPNSKVRQAVRIINSGLAGLGKLPRVRFADLGFVLLEEDGQLSPEISYDGIHLTHAGYARWAGAMKPLIHNILNQQTTRHEAQSF